MSLTLDVSSRADVVRATLQEGHRDTIASRRERASCELPDRANTAYCLSSLRLLPRRWRESLRWWRFGPSGSTATMPNAYLEGSDGMARRYS